MKEIVNGVFAELVETEEAEEDMIPVKQDTKKAVASIFVIKEGSMHKVLVDNILYFESYDKRVYAALKSGKYEVKQRLFEIEELLEQQRRQIEQMNQ